MAATTKIGWTDATVNFWWGCTKLGPGCDFCYANDLDKRYGGDHWGVGAPRRKIKSAIALLRKLNKAGRKRVFIQSMSDLFDAEVPAEWFDEAMCAIEEATNTTVQIVTKRIALVKRRLDLIGRRRWPRNAGLIITTVNQPEVDRDGQLLLDVRDNYSIPWTGLSIEPILGPIDLYNGDPDPSLGVTAKHTMLGQWWDADQCRLCPPHYGVDWVIVGGESGPHARPPHPDWIRSLRNQCASTQTAFFFKQWGEWKEIDGPRCRSITQPYTEKDVWIHKDGSILRNRGLSWAERPSPYFTSIMRRVGKEAAGNLLDGEKFEQHPDYLESGVW